MTLLRGPPAAPLRHLTLQAALASAAASEVGLAFIDAREQETSLPFRELHVRAQRVAGALRALGVAPADRVALLLPTGPDFMDAFFGALYAGAIPVPLYPPVRLGRLDEFHARTTRMLERSGARLVLTDARIERLLGVSIAQARPALGCRTVASVRGGAGVEHQHVGQPDELALIQFSSGTTVDPKPVALTHRNVLSNAAAIDTYLPDDGGLRPSGVSWLPLYHDMGLIGCLVLSVVHPGPLALLPPELFLSRPALWLRTIARRRATITVAPNFAYGLCLKRVRDEELDGVDLSSLRLALNGAEPVAPPVLRRFAERFARFGLDPAALLPVYGLSEASLAVTFSARLRTVTVGAEGLARGEVIPGPPAVGPAREATGPTREIASVGTPLPGMSVCVRDPAGNPARAARVGRVHVQGPSVMSGYFGDAPATNAAITDGWLDTGDLGFVEGGELFLCGRAKEIVILRGRNHAPQAFEDALDGLAGVRAGCAAAVGFVPGGADGEELALLVERDAGPGAVGDGPDQALIERIRARVVERTGIRADTVRLLAPGTLPRTSSGKIRRAEALRQMLAGELTPPRRVTRLGIAREAARSWLAFARLRRGS